MKLRIFCILAATVAAMASVHAQTQVTELAAADSTAGRVQALKEARYLKSIFKTDQAIERLSTYVKPGVLDEEILAELADCHFQNGDYESAAGTYFLLSSAAPQNIFYKVRQMQNFFRMKAFGQSAEAGKAILQWDTIPAVAEAVGDSYSQMNMPDSALTYYRLALAVKPLNEKVAGKAAKIFLDRKDYDGAISLADGFLALDPDNETIAPVKGLALYSKERYAEAIGIFENQLKKGNGSYPVHYYLGQSYWRTKNLGRAEEELKAAWQIDSSNANLAYSIGAVLSDGYHTPKYVQPWLDRAVEMIRPDSLLVSRINQQYGLGYYRQMDWNKAIEYYTKAYSYNPEFISAVSTVAYCYEQMKDYKSAAAWYEKYLTLAKPGSKGYNFAKQSLNYLKGELFMEE